MRVNVLVARRVGILIINIVNIQLHFNYTKYKYKKILVDFHFKIKLNKLKVTNILILYFEISTSRITG